MPYLHFFNNYGCWIGFFPGWCQLIDTKQSNSVCVKVKGCCFFKQSTLNKFELIACFCNHMIK